MKQTTTPAKATPCSFEDRTPLFRPHALNHYAQRATEPVLPKCTAPGGFIGLWLLLAGLVSAGGLALCYPVPLYTRGVAAPIFSKSDRTGGPLIALFIPAETADRLRIGQRVLITVTPAGAPESAHVASVYPGTLTREQIDELVDHTASAAPTLAGLKAVALAELDPTSTTGLTRDNLPHCCEALVEVGSRRVINLFGWGQAQG